MRLIDADAKITELKHRSCLICQDNQYQEDKCIRYGVCLVDDVLITEFKNAPTIDAIPVDWISKRIGELIAHGHVSQASCLAAEIISLWREEHETN